MKLITHLFRIVVLSASIIAAGTVMPIHAEQAPECFSTAWPSDMSDLQPDPSLVRGKLENGFRYVIKKNSEPKDRVAIYLNIQAGSLHETEGQRGYAHFLEHMLFNGTSHFPPGKLVEYFQSIGMSFGGDTNAHTTYDETVYKIVLPKGSREHLRSGFLVMADYARNALLLESEIEREKGVILAEKRARDSASYRAHVAENGFTLRGTRMPERLPIGVVETLQNANHAKLKQFYDAWYRPENMVLVVVGDASTEEVHELITEFFSPLKGAGLKPECPRFGTLQHSGLETFYHYEEELGRTDIGVETLWDRQRENDSFELQLAQLREYLGALIMQRRLDKLMETADIPFTGGRYYSGDILQRVGYGGVTVQTDDKNWRKTVHVLENSLRQAVEYGFGEDELDRVRRDILADIDEAVQTASTRESLAIGRDIIHHLNANRVYQSPQQEKDTYSEAIAQFTVEQVNAAFRRIWNRPSRLITVSGNTKLEPNTAREEIEKEYLRATGEEVEPLQNTVQTEFPYLDYPEGPVAPVSSKKFAAIDVEQLRFDNGVLLNLKQTDFADNHIDMAINFGEGRVSEPQSGLSILAGPVINNSGTGRLKGSDLIDILAGSTVNVQFRIGESSFTLSGGCVVSDSEKLFQMASTMLRDPGFRPEAYQRAMQNIDQMYDGLQRQVTGAMRLRLLRFLAGGDTRIGLPAKGEIDQMELEDVRDWLLPQYQQGRMEVNVVGDFQRERIVRLAGKYFGTLPKREGAEAKVAGLVFPEGQTLHASVDTSLDKALVVVAWPTDDFWDISRTRRLHMLADVFAERLRQVIREKLGASYSPAVYSTGSRIYPDYGFLLVQVLVEPGREGEILHEIKRIGEDLRENGVADEELQLVKQPVLTSLKGTVRTNAYWLRSVLSLSSRHPQQLDWPTTILSDFGAITAQEISQLAGKYLLADRAATALVVPESSSEDIKREQ